MKHLENFVIFCYGCNPKNPGYIRVGFKQVCGNQGSENPAPADCSGTLATGQHQAVQTGQPGHLLQAVLGLECQATRCLHRVLGKMVNSIFCKNLVSLNESVSQCCGCLKAWSRCFVHYLVLGKSDQLNSLL